jgi:peptidyl-prolyl cis-trans isomerase A (cyclophilin A)
MKSSAHLTHAGAYRAGEAAQTRVRWRRSRRACLGAVSVGLLIGALAFAQTAAKPVSVIFETELGKITVEVDVGHAPTTGANFLKYVDGRFYDGGVINRAVRPDNTNRHDVEIQVIQFQENPARSREMFPAIPLERTSVTGLKHVDGALSMARGAAPDTAQASFFIPIGDYPSMDFGGKRNADGQGFAAFGRVVDGMDVVKKIHASHTGGKGDYGTETLDPPVRILQAYRKAR